MNSNMTAKYIDGIITRTDAILENTHADVQTLRKAIKQIKSIALDAPEVIS